jgi:hypothetical protein
MGNGIAGFLTVLVIFALGVLLVYSIISYNTANIDQQKEIAAWTEEGLVTKEEALSLLKEDNRVTVGEYESLKRIVAARVHTRTYEDLINSTKN